MSNKRLLLGRENAEMRYSAAYPTGRERIVKDLLYHGGSIVSSDQFV